MRICSLEEMTLHTTATLDFSDMENIHFSMYCDGEGGSGTLEIGFQAKDRKRLIIPHYFLFSKQTNGIM